MNKEISLPMLFLLVTCLLQFTNGLKLLGVFPMPATSHYNYGVQLMKGYAKAGHDITFITPYVTKNVPKNVSWEDIYLEELEQSYRETLKNVNMFEDSNRSGIERILSYQSVTMDSVNKTLYHPKVRKLLKSGTKFDAVIMEPFFNDAHKYFAHYYQCPLILVALAPLPWVNNIVGNPSPPSYMPHFFQETSSPEFTFLERFSNLYYYIQDYIFEHWYIHSLHNDLLQQAFPGAPSIEELNERTSLVMLCSHYSLKQAVPLVPNMVEIGGYHIDPPKMLPKDLQEFLDNSKEGVIYFSMGSNLKSKEMSLEKREILLKVFAKLKLNIIWKFEDEHLEGKTENILIKKWLPQQDILAHPNIKLFITHGGFLSTTETVYHGVPILAIPVFADQFINSNIAVQQGYGLKIPYNDDNFTEENLYAMIQELLNNPKYREHAQKVSKIFHDRPMKPIETAVYWTEYVIKHDGAKHLRVAGTKLTWYKYFMLDVLLFLLSTVFIIFHIIKLSFKLIFSQKKLVNEKSNSNLAAAKRKKDRKNK